MFKNASNTDASRSTFTDVGRDQYTLFSTEHSNAMYSQIPFDTSAIPAFPHTQASSREMLGDFVGEQDDFVSSINEGASIGSTCATSSQYTHTESVTTAKVTVIKCRICRIQTADICCFTCDPAGIPFHEGKCWKMMPLHEEGGLQYRTHRPAPIASLVRIRYLNKPNQQTSISDSKFKEDKSNCFIEFKELFRFGDRAFPLLRGGSDRSKIQYPSFVSFVGRSMHGKSFLIRALQYREADSKQPAPIPSPGAKERNHDSTSSDIHLYADSATACDESPILLLDCEGFDGTDVPTSLKAEGVTDRLLEKTAYPRLIYVFSTCVVFVTSGPLGGADDIKTQLISYASEGASGSRNQGFKPSLFVVFNCFEGGDASGFDWSIKASSDAFLRNSNLAILDNFYSSIHVVYIPRMNSSKAPIALQQLDAFDKALRAEHEKAFQQRRAFRLNFTPGQLTPFLQKALDRLRDRKLVFDWASEVPLSVFSSNQSDAILVDLWTQYLRHHTDPKSFAIAYDRVRKDFVRHVKFCLRLRLSRHRPYGTHIEEIPPQWNEQMVQLCLEYTQCGVSQNGVKCGKIQFRHGDYHEDLCANRWQGEYKRDTSPFRSFRDSFKEALKGQSKDVSIGDLSKEEIPEDIRSVVSCLGCLQEPPGTVLACGHAFCFNCIRELTPDQPLPHRLNDIHCPIHKQLQKFSPRLLPTQSACRILSLDGGGVKGLAQLTILRHIEKRCFNVPVIHLFDLIVGTSIGGQIALALTVGTPSGPLTVAEVSDAFPKLMQHAFQKKAPLLGGTSLFFGKTTYKAAPLESHLKNLFGEETKLYSAPTSSRWSVPNVAVTTVLDSIEARLVTNYNRTPLDDTLLFGPTPEESMPAWAAARCTSAAYPYFKPLKWQGKMLFDGGFKLNCPAARAYSEAKSIWPDKQCDILLSLGTGNRPPPKLHTFIGVATAVAGDISDAQKAWDEFQDGPLQRFRLNPGYRGTGFGLDDVRKLNDIQNQTEEWIATKNDKLSNICDRLIAALFFFRPLGEMNDGVQVGEILCRLPADLEARQKLVEGMLKKAGLPLFAVKYNGNILALVSVGKIFRDLRSTAELRLEVTLCDFPVTGEIEIVVEMRSLGMHPLAEFQWLPISGSPYVIRKNLHGLEDPDTLATDITGNVQLDPQYPHPIVREVEREVYRGLYTWTNPDTFQVISEKVAFTQLPVVSAGVEQRKLEQRVEHKVAILRNLKHPNIIQFLGIAYVFPGRPPCLVHPLAPRNDILTYIGYHPDSKYGKAWEVARGVQYLHYEGIVHGDLQVENISVSEDVAQINFSMSRILDISGSAMKILRDIRFNAPELISEEAGAIAPTSKSDIFSLAIFFLQLFHGPDTDFQRRLPYNHIRHKSTYDLELLRRICKGERPIRDRYTVMSDQHWNILSQCWQGDPSGRPDIDWVVNAL